MTNRHRNVVSRFATESNSMAKAELEKASLDTDGMVESTAKLRDLILGIAHVDILEDDEKTFKSTYEIIKEISKVWNTIDDEVQKSALLEAIGGKMQSNIIASVLNNGELLEDVYEKASKSEGVAMQEQEKWAKSIEASFNRINAIFETISSEILDSQTFKSALDTFASILEFVEKITSQGKGLSVLMGTVGTLLGATKAGLVDVGVAGGGANKIIRQYNAEVGKGKNAANLYAQGIAKENAALGNYLVSLNGATASTNKFRLSQIAAAAAAKVTSIVVTAANMAINAFIGIGISVLITETTKLINKNKELIQEFGKATDEIKSTTEELDEYKSSVDAIVQSDIEESEKLEKLNEIKDELSRKYRREIDDLNDVAEARRILNEEIEKEKSYDVAGYLAENAEAYNKAKKSAEKAIDNYDITVFETPSLDDVSKNIKSFFNEIKENEVTTGLSLDSNGLTPFEYFEKIKKVYDELSSLKRDSKDGFTLDEENILIQVENAYKKLKKKLYESNGDLEEFISGYANQRAWEIVNNHTREQSETLEQWRSRLIEFAKGDIYVIESLQELMTTEEKVEYITKESASAFALMSVELSKVGEQAEEISGKVKQLNEQFEDLEKVYKTNNDTNKFFSASEIIELLDKYPSLYNAILETASGYKIEKEALDNLRDTKIDEQKISLQTQLQEAKNQLDSTKVKLSAFQQEIKGIKDVAKARLQLSELENKLAQIQNVRLLSGFNGLSQIVSKTGGKLDMYTQLEKDAANYEQEIQKLDIQLAVLGKTFDDTADDGSKLSTELNKQKSLASDLKEAYKNESDEIENLVKLTMDMLKKQADVRKDDLKNQLESYKKIIDRKKELIDLEKEQYEFEKNIKDQNKEISKIQSELDALSVSGAEYSLEDMKRKAELQEKLAEAQEKQTDTLYDREVDLRKDALDKEKDNFEENINAQIDMIEDYLKREGDIRQEAIRLINGKTQAFYNDLYNYTVTYTDKSEFEFQQLWNNAYLALEKYGNGQIDVSAVLAFLAMQLDDCEQRIKQLDLAADQAKNGISDLAKTIVEDMGEANRVAGALVDNVAGLGAGTWGLVNMANSAYQQFQEMSKYGHQPVTQFKNNLLSSYISNWQKLTNLSSLPKYHSGGLVTQGTGNINPESEVLAKLMTGEVVITPTQAREFMSNTLPQLTQTSNYVSDNAPVITIGDINIQGNADSATVQQLDSIRKQIGEDVMKMVNDRNRVYNGRRIK